ncbi:MAG: hypothetical protein CMK38_06965 [Porticoccaceae bacterium]|nr:hypothetical protein [Porticoccaceae bacterium]
MNRFQKNKILDDLQKKIVILVGPRQAGKTWLSHEIAKEFKSSVYLNYDNIKHQKIIKNYSWLDDTELLIFDELHKMPDWKNHLKGIYDTKLGHQKILVTGSARLDAFNQLGESLAGRYFRHRLFPVTCSEIRSLNLSSSSKTLLDRGGFPESFLTSNQNDRQRWRLQYINGLIREDVLDFERIYDLKKMQYLVEMLRDRVGSTISIQSLARDLELHANTVKKYISILESLFIVFSILPFSKSISRSILKEPKIYFYDIGLVEDKGPRFENLVALDLLQHCQFSQDYQGEDVSLHYLRTKEKKEVDFAVVRNETLKEIVECKLSDTDLSKHLSYFANKYNVEATQVVQNIKTEYKAKNCSVQHIDSYLNRFSDIL